MVGLANSLIFHLNRFERSQFTPPTSYFDLVSSLKPIQTETKPLSQIFSEDLKAVLGARRAPVMLDHMNSQLIF